MSVPSSPPPTPPLGGPPRLTSAPKGWAAFGLVGIVVLVVGTFLPWIRSGRVGRNSYEIAGVGARRLDVDVWVESVLQAWRFVGPLWAVVVVLMISGLRRTAASAALILAAFTGVVAIGGLVLAVRSDTAPLAGVVLGPAVTLAGSAAAAVAAVAALRSHASTPAPAVSGSRG